MGLHKTKMFLHSKGNIQRRERQPTEWKEIFPKDTPKNVFIPKIYEQLIQLNAKKPHKKTKNPTQLNTGQRT